MPTLMDNVLRVMRVRRAKNELGPCAVCGDSVHANDQVTSLRGGDLVHRDCATYRIREARTGGRSAAAR